MDLTNLLRGVFALAIVLGLILALAYGLRRYAPNILARISAPRGRKRLQIMETLVLDPTRRVVLVRVDDEDRLILLGEGRELIEPRPHAEAKPVAVANETPPRPRPVVAAAGGPAMSRMTATAYPRPSPPPAALSPLSRSQPKDPNDDLF